MKTKPNSPVKPNIMKQFAANALEAARTGRLPVLQPVEPAATSKAEPAVAPCAPTPDSASLIGNGGSPSETVRGPGPDSGTVLQSQDAPAMRINLMKYRKACHEAAHATVARHLGIPIQFATCNPSEDGKLSAWVKILPSGVFRIWSLAAGNVANIRTFGSKYSKREFESSSGADYAMIYELLELRFDQYEAYIKKLEDDVAGFLYQPDIWRIVAKFAEALEREGSLKGDACMALTNDVPRADREVIKRIILDPTFHNRMGRRIGRTKLGNMNRLLGEAVQSLHPTRRFSLWRCPSGGEIIDDLVEEGTSFDDAWDLVRGTYADWPKLEFPWCDPKPMRTPDASDSRVPIQAVDAQAVPAAG